MIILVIIIAITYLIVIGLFFWGWMKLKPASLPEIFPQTHISVIIPVRNEQATISGLIQCLLTQNYPSGLTEIILINDHSTDKTIEIIHNLNNPNIHLIHLPSAISGKKAALLEGSNAATGELIITTDADCEPGPEWISTLVASYVTTNSVLLVAPVAFRPLNNMNAKFQALEFLSLQGSAAGAIGAGFPIMCNGANLAFSRKCLPLIHSTYINSRTASGDDIFTLLSVKEHFPNHIHFIKSEKAIVYTSPSQSIIQFFNQRKRWSAKAKFYSDPLLIITALSVFSISLLLTILLISSCFTGNWTLFCGLFLLKSAIDLPFLYHISSFFKEKKLLRWFPIIQSLYFPYVTITFVWSLFGGYTWKSRKYRN